MSVFQRGGNYLHRRLTKLYSDTKQSYETASVACKNTPDENPDLQALRRDFRYQKDRLLAWGLQWSDSNAPSSSDVEIDQKIDQAGLGQVVGRVMSDIQKLLVESEMIQSPTASFEAKKSSGQIPCKASLEKHGDMTCDDITKFQSLLSQLTTCIESLYKLSESRRNLSASSPEEKILVEGPAETSRTRMSISSSRPQCVTPLAQALQDQSQGLDLILQDSLFIHPSWIRLVVDGTAVSETPPPYDELMLDGKARRLGQIVVSNLSKDQLSIFGCQGCDQRPVLIEYSPLPQKGSYDFVVHCQLVRSYTYRIISRQRSLPIFHDGVLPLLGYTIDTIHTRHGFIFAMPNPGPQRALSDRLPLLTNLRAIIPPQRDESDPPSPSLEDRFRLGFNILLGILHLWVEGRRSGNLDSTNIVVMLNRHVETEGPARAGIASDDVRRPYLVHSPLSPGPLSAEADALSASIYRHANDTQHDARDRPWAFEIYSLGLILLEIGLWVPLSRLWKPKYSKSTFTSRIKEVYIPKLASKCGATYMKVVRRCVDAPDRIVADLHSISVKEQAESSYSYLTRSGGLLSRCCYMDGSGPRCARDLRYLKQLIRKRSPPWLLPKINDSALALELSSHSAISSTSADPTSGVKAVTQPETSSASSPRHQTTVKKWNDVDIPQKSLDQWNTYLMPRISMLLQKALGASRESCSASIMMVGKTPETAKTTICIQCTSVDKVRDCLQRDFKCKKGWGLVILKGDVRRSTADALRGNKGENREYQKQPQFGASIGAYRDHQHLPPVSFGGAILVDGKPYGMTVHHMLDAPSDDEDDSEDGSVCGVPRSAANQPSDVWLPEVETRSHLPHCDELHLGSSDDVLDLFEDESEGSTIRPEYIDLETGQGGFWFAGDDDMAPGLEEDLAYGSDPYDSSDTDDVEDEEDRVSVGDISGLDALHDEEIYVTQPAIDDVEDNFFPCVEDRDDEHLASHSFGSIHASSGIRRVVIGAIKHEVDWALIKIRDDRLTLGNIIRQDVSSPGARRRGTASRSGMSREGPEASPTAAIMQLTSIAPSSTFSRLPVQCHARTSGLQSGRISPALALIKLCGRTSFSSSWVVEGGAFGVPGDSGAWIYDPQTGRVCGHVLAWGSRSHTAYMAPMDVLFDDIRRRLGAERVELPYSEALGSGVEHQGTGPFELEDVLPDGVQARLICDRPPSLLSRSPQRNKLKDKVAPTMKQSPLSARSSTNITTLSPTSPSNRFPTSDRSQQPQPQPQLQSRSSTSQRTSLMSTSSTSSLLCPSSPPSSTIIDPNDESSRDLTSSLRSGPQQQQQEHYQQHHDNQHASQTPSQHAAHESLAQLDHRQQEQKQQQQQLQIQSY